MAQFHTTSSSVSTIETIISNANKELILVSPFIDLGKNYYERLLKKAEDKVNITIVCRFATLNADNLSLLKSINNIAIRNLNDLYAKCFYNGEDMLLTSMNLYKHSQDNNYEMGISINRTTDKALFDPALRELEYIVKSSILVNPKVQEAKTIKPSNKNLDGNCIRCITAIEFDFDKPYCKSCYTSWSKFENEDYPEKYCMSCGKSNETSFAKPICYPCYKASNK
jgi:hypothetical protein